VNIRAPAGQAISIDCCQQTLRDGFEQIFRLQIFPVESFANTIELFTTGAYYDEILLRTTTEIPIQRRNKGDTPGDDGKESDTTRAWTCVERTVYTGAPRRSIAQMKGSAR